MNLGFSSWQELSRRFDTRRKTGRNWDQIRKLRDRTYLMEWVSMGGGTLPWPKIAVYVGKSTFPSVSSITDRLFNVLGQDPYHSICLGPNFHMDSPKFKIFNISQPVDCIQAKSWEIWIFETFRYLVEDWEELGPPMETSRWNLSHGMGFDGRKDHHRPQNPRKSLKILFSKI